MLFSVFYLRSFSGNLSIPLSWWPTGNIPAFQLTSLFWEAVCVCEVAGVDVLAVVADGAATNRKFFDIIHGSKFNIEEGYTAPNPCCLEREIYICGDTSHLLKVCRKFYFV